jgi:hypothetical protein
MLMLQGSYVFSGKDEDLDLFGVICHFFAVGDGL